MVTPPPALSPPPLPPMLLLQMSMEDPRVYWTVVMAGALLVVYVVLIRPAKRRRADPLAKSPVPSSLAQQRAVERDMNSLLVELTEMARQMSAQLDTRAARLELLIKEADEKIATLRAATGRDREAGTLTNMGIGPVRDDPAGAATGDDNNSADDPRHAQVYALSDQGRSAPEIARELGRANGEIELILALREKA